VKICQIIILTGGIVGILLYIFLSVALRFHVFGVLTQVEEIKSEVKIYRALFDLSLLMAMLALAWRVFLPKDSNKIRFFIVFTYLIPGIIDVCMLIVALIWMLYAQ